MEECGQVDLQEFKLSLNVRSPTPMILFTHCPMDLFTLSWALDKTFLKTGSLYHTNILFPRMLFTTIFIISLDIR